MNARSKDLDTFTALSAALTGFDAAHLIGTGNAARFWDLLVERAGAENARDLLDAWRDEVEPAADADRAMRVTILGDARRGPLARNLVRLWYVGTWRRLPEAWRMAHAPGLPDGDVVPGRDAYTEALLWPAIGANPPGAKPHGYGMWARPPRAPAPRSPAPPLPPLQR